MPSKMAADVQSGDEVAGGIHFQMRRGDVFHHSEVEINDVLTRLAGGGLALLPPYGGAKRAKRFSTQSKATTREFGVTCCSMCPNIQVYEGGKKGRWHVCAVIVAQGRESCCTYGEPSAVIWFLYPVASKAARVFHSQPQVRLDTSAAEKLQAA